MEYNWKRLKDSSGHVLRQMLFFEVFWPCQWKKKLNNTNDIYLYTPNKKLESQNLQIIKSFNSLRPDISYFTEKSILILCVQKVLNLVKHL